MYKNLKEKYGLDCCNIGDVFSNNPMSWVEFHNLIINNTKDGEMVLDAGAGEGNYKKIFKNKEIEYIGIDSKVGHKNWNYSEVIEGDIENLNFKNEYFDKVLLIQVLEHVTSPEKVIRELGRVIKKNGSIFIAFPQGQSVHQIPNDFYRFTPYGIKYILEKNGFEIKMIRPQLYGDNEANIKRLMWSLDFVYEQVNFVNKIIIFILKIKMTILQKICKRLDRKSERHINPIGYFLEAKKV